MQSDAMRAAQNITQGYNDKIWALFGAQFVDEAIGIVPNHEPLRGRAAIIEYYRQARDVAGEVEQTEVVRVTTTEKLVSLARAFSTKAGGVRVLTHEAFERQPDGSVRAVVDMFGARDPMR